MRIAPSNSSYLVQQLAALSAQETEISQQISTGTRLTTFADDPVASATTVQLSHSIAQQDTFQSAATSALARMQSSDSALSSVVTALSNAIQLGVQGSNGTMSASNLQAIAQQISGVRDSVLSLANSSYLGTYLFAGTSGTTQPFTADSSGNVTYSGDDNTTSLTAPGGAALQTSVAGSTLFSSGTASDVFTALNQLISDFSSGTASSTSAADIGTLRDALDTFSQQRSILGSSMSRLTAANDNAATILTTLKATQSTLIASDTAELATQLSQTETRTTALSSTIAATQKGSLFDYL